MNSIISAKVLSTIVGGSKLAGKDWIYNFMHISEYSDSNAGVQPDTFAMRFSRL